MEDGSCLALRCPEASCSRAVLRGMIGRFATLAARDAYSRHLARAYVGERHVGLKPCTAAGCRLLSADSRDADMACACGNAFYWRSGGEQH